MNVRAGEIVAAGTVGAKPARDRYVSIVKHHCPGCVSPDLELRCSILTMRDNALSSMRRCGEDSYPLLDQVQRISSLYAFRAMSTERLKDLRYQLLRLTQAASGIEAFSFGFRHPGGADAGG